MTQLMSQTLRSHMMSYAILMSPPVERGNMDLNVNILKKYTDRKLIRRWASSWDYAEIIIQGVNNPGANDPRENEVDYEVGTNFSDKQIITH